MKQPSASFRPDRERLARDVRRLAMPRHPVASPHALKEAEDLVALELDAAGFRVERQIFEWRGREFHNVVATLDGDEPQRPWVVVGAHFDSVAHCPGADDNASGVAVMLEVARLLGAGRPQGSVQCVGFNLEEVQDYFGNYRIGSRAYVEWLRRQRARLAGALVLEMVGFTGPRQVVPATVKLVKRVPDTGSFIAAVGDGESQVPLQAFERAADGVLPFVTLAVPLKGWLVPDTRRSDNARFWDGGFPALMVTDTADLRNPNYHRVTDTPETLDYDFLTRVTEVVAVAAADLAGAWRRSGGAPRAAAT
jgi:Zn-dependent M28 family amino/carboxypeptidase